MVLLREKNNSEKHFQRKRLREKYNSEKNFQRKAKLRKAI
jgi:hypothetical protein